MSDGYYIRSFLATLAGLTAFIAVIAGLAFYSQVIAWGFLCAAVFFLVWFYKTPGRRAAHISGDAPSNAPDKSIRGQASIGELPSEGGRYPR